MQASEHAELELEPAVGDGEGEDLRWNETGVRLYLKMDDDLLGPAEGRVDEEDRPENNQTDIQLYFSLCGRHSRHLYVEQNGAGHDDEAIGITFLQLLKGQKHEVGQAEGDAQDKEREYDRTAPARRALVVLDVEVGAAFGAQSALVADGAGEG